MKKWLLPALLALLMLCCMTAQGEGPEAFVGYWELDGLELDGRYVSGADLDFTVVVSIREDDTMYYNLADEQFAVETVTCSQVNGEWVCRSTLDAMSEMRIDENGLLCYTLTSDREMKVWMHRGAPAGDPVTGLWTVDHAFRDGERQERTVLRDISLMIGPDQYGVLQVSEKRIDVRLFLQDGKPVLLRKDGHIYPSKLSADGTLLSFDLESTQGTAWTLVLRREEPAAGETAAVPAAQDPEAAFAGEWRAQQVIALGNPMPLKQAGGPQDIRMIFDGDQVRLVVDDETEVYGVTYLPAEAGSGLRCTVADESDTVDVECEIDAQGQLLMHMSGDSGVITFVMTRVDGGTAAAPEAENIFEGSWTAKYTYRGDTTITREAVGLPDVGLVFEGRTVMVRMGDRSAMYPVEFTYGADGRMTGCRFIDDSDSVDVECGIDEQGRVLMHMDGDSGVITIVLERDPAAPAAQPEGYDGMWTLTHVIINGKGSDAASVGLSGSVRIAGETARYTVGEESLLGVVSLTDTGLTVTCRSGEYVFSVNDAGQLCQEAENFGMKLTLCFTRQAE